MSKALNLLEEIYMIEKRSNGLTLFQLAKLTRKFDRTQKVVRIPIPCHLTVYRVKFVPYIGTSSLLVSGYVESASRVGIRYPAVIYFRDVDFVKSELARGQPGFFVLGYKDTTVGVKQLDAMRNRVQVRCGCPDFYFRFGWYLKENNAFYGKGPKPYVRKTTWWPSVNPERIPGMCKHLWNLVALLVRNNMVRNIKPY